VRQDLLDHVAQRWFDRGNDLRPATTRTRCWLSLIDPLDEKVWPTNVSQFVGATAFTPTTRPSSKP